MQRDLAIDIHIGCLDDHKGLPIPSFCLGQQTIIVILERRSLYISPSGGVSDSGPFRRSYRR